MAAPGTIVLAVADLAIQNGDMRHLFNSLGGQFDSTLCITPIPFTIAPNETHVLITDLDEIFGAVLQTSDGRRGPQSINGLQSPLQLCYGVRLNSPDMMLHVGRNTSLSLLLRAGCLKVTAFVVTKEQISRVLRPPPRAPPASPASSAAAEEQDGKSCSPLPHASPPQPVNNNDDDDDDDVVDIEVIDL